MNKKRSSWLPVAFLLLGQAACAVPATHAGNFDLNSTVNPGSSDSDSKVTLDKGNDNLGDGNFGRQRFTISSDVRFGYDDNTLGQPDSFSFQAVNPNTGKIVTETQHVNTSSSAFFNFDLGVGYTAATSRLSLTAGADVGVTYYFDRPGRSYDINGGISGRLTYKLTPRAFLDLSTYNAYESQGDFGASDLTNFNGQFGGSGRTPGTIADRDGDYFYTTDNLTLTYQLAPRVSLVGSENIVAFAYDDQPYSTVQDRIEVYTGLELQYLLLPTLTLAADYRFGYIDYFSVSNDSQTHFILGGFDYSPNQRLHASVRAGAEFREYFDTVGDETSPYATANVVYNLSHGSAVSFSAQYGIQEGDLAVQNTESDTISLGLDYNQNITTKISAYVGFYYTHSFYETPTTDNEGSFTEDTYDVSVGARYAINRHFSAELGYTHTTVDSGVQERSYDRNRYFGGVRFSF